jgi:8-oxo-dGTP pyrophosphatase MutT (NUDIX family)
MWAANGLDARGSKPGGTDIATTDRMRDERDHVRGLVAARVPVDEREARSRRRFLAELARLERPFDELADPVHVTASAVVVGPRGVLLHLHKRLLLWLQPGGHIDEGETPEEAAVREVREETGLVCAAPEFVHVDVHPGPKGHTHLDLRYLLHADGDPDPAPGESEEVRWFDWDEAIAVADPGLRGILRALRPPDRRFG